MFFRPYCLTILGQEVKYWLLNDTLLAGIVAPEFLHSLVCIFVVWPKSSKGNPNLSGVWELKQKILDFGGERERIFFFFLNEILWWILSGLRVDWNIFMHGLGPWAGLRLFYRHWKKKWDFVSCFLSMWVDVIKPSWQKFLHLHIEDLGCPIY